MALTMNLTTTGTLNPVVVTDLGKRSFPHPTTNYNLITEYRKEELLKSLDLQTAITSGYITLTYENANAIRILQPTNNVFGEGYSVLEVPAETSTTSITLQTKLTLAYTPENSGTYRIGIYGEVRQGTANRQVRIFSNNSIGTILDISPMFASNVATNYLPIHCMENQDLVGNTAYTFIIQYCTVTSGTAFMRNAKIEIWRVK